MYIRWLVACLALVLPLLGEAQRHDLPQEEFGIRIATHFGSGDCSAGTLNAAMSSLGSTVTTLVIPPVARNSIAPCVWNLAANVTVPATMRISIPRGTILRPALGITVTFHSPPDVTGPFQIFDANSITTGTIKFQYAGLVHAEWWGAKGDGNTDSSRAIHQALHSGIGTQEDPDLTNFAMTVQLQGGKFLIGSSIVPPVNDFVGWTLQGMGRIATTLERTPAFTGTMIDIGTNIAGTRITRVRGLRIDCIDRPALSKGIRLIQAPWTTVEEVDIKRCDIGIHQSGGIGQSYRHVFVDACNTCLLFDNLEEKSIVDVSLERVHARQCLLYALKIDGSDNSQLVREINLYGFVTDRGVEGGNNTCVRIHGAERIRFYGSHLEQCQPFFHVTDTPLKQTSHILMYGGVLGDLNEGNTCQDCRNTCDVTPACDVIASCGTACAGTCRMCRQQCALDLGPPACDEAVACATPCRAILWDTPNKDGGVASVLEGMDIKEGLSSFVSEFKIPIRNSKFPSDGRPTGNGFVLHNNTDVLDDAYSRDMTAGNWVLFRADKLMPTHNMRYQRRLATLDTTDATDQVMVNLNTGPNSSHIFNATVIGKRTDNSTQGAYEVHCLFSTNADASVSTLVSAEVTPLEGAGATGWDVTCVGTPGAPGCAAAQIRVDHNDNAYTVRWSAMTEIIQVLREAADPGAPLCEDPEPE